MKPKTLILMVAAVGCGLGAAYMTNQLVANRNRTESVERKVAVLVAAKNIPMGQLVKDPEKVFTIALRGEEDVPKKAIKSGVLENPPNDAAQLPEDVRAKLWEQVKERCLNKSLTEGNYVNPDDLMDKHQYGLQAVMSKGMRAVTVKVDAASSAGGFALPNSRVDVLWVKRGNEQEAVAKTILQNVLVLAVDTHNVRPDDKQAVLANTVTLEVSPEQSERLALAVATGDLRLTLRAFGDEESVKSQGAKIRTIATGPSSTTDTNSVEEVVSEEPAKVWAQKLPDVKVQPTPPPVEAAKAPEPPPAPKTHLLTIVNGESIRKVRFNLDSEDAEPIIDVQKPTPNSGPGK
jgi:pilus assembly protein CpaB